MAKGGLGKWFSEEWIDVKTGKPCGRSKGEKRAYPACRPKAVAGSISKREAAKKKDRREYLGPQQHQERKGRGAVKLLFFYAD